MNKPGAIISSILFLILSVILSSELYAQTDPDNIPASFITGLDEPVLFEKMPEMDNQFLLENAHKDDFAAPIEVRLTPSGNGAWSKAGDHNIWRMGIISETALSLSVSMFYDGFGEDWRLFVYDSEYKSVHGPFTYKDFSEYGFTVAPVPGNKIIVEVNTSTPENFPLRIHRVNHDFKGFYSNSSPELRGYFGNSQPCQVDVACDRTLGIEKNAVCLIVTSGLRRCTANIMNNTSEDQTPYLLTAAHCIRNQPEAANATIYFNYERTECDKNDESLGKKMYGADWLVWDPALDICLIQLKNPIPRSFNPYYAGWDRSGEVNGSVHIIHHPNSDVKKVSRSNNPPITGTFISNGIWYIPDAFWRVQKWDQGCTEGGSSGAGLFDIRGRLVGTLSGGESYCNTPFNDYFAKFNTAWTQYPDDPAKNLTSWLDPSGTGTIRLNGLDPYTGYAATCDTIRHDKVLLSTSTIPARSAEAYAEFFHNIYEKVEISGFYIKIRDAEKNNTQYFNFKLWKGHNFPEEVIASKTVPINDMYQSNTYYVDFGETFTITGNYFLGVETDGISSSACNFEYGKTNILTNGKAMVHKNGQWIDMKSFLNVNNEIVFSIYPVICGEKILLSPTQTFNDLIHFPNPTPYNSVLFLGTKAGESLETVKCYNNEGKEVGISIKYSNDFIPYVELNNRLSGTYILKIKTNIKKYTRRWIVTK